MTTALAHQEDRQVARPLKVLVPLIKDDLQRGDDAAERAGMPYYVAAGKKLIEAKAQLARGEWKPWLERNFDRSARQAERYMALASATSTTGDIQNRRARPVSLSEFIRETGGSPRGAERGGVSWQEPVKEILNKVDVEALNLRQAELKRADEREEQRKLAIQLIDIGYKALATKLHPDRGGSRDAMSRLNQVRDRLKAHA